MTTYYSPVLYHHGIKGQKWGIRRYQNADGSLTSEGRARYGYGKVGNAINAVGKIGGRRYTANGNRIKYRRKDEQGFSTEKSKGKKAIRAVTAVSTLGVGRFASRFAYNHRNGIRIANGLMMAATAGTSLALLGPAALPGVAMNTGKQIAQLYAAEKLNDALYENVYLKDKSKINKDYKNTRKTAK